MNTINDESAMKKSMACTYEIAENETVSQDFGFPDIQCRQCNQDYFLQEL